MTEHAHNQQPRGGANDGAIYLVSTAGIPNFGDELIAHRWVSYLARVAPHREVWLDVREPRTVSSLLKGIHPNLHVTNTAIRAVHSSLHESDRSVTDLVQNLGSPRFDVGLLEMREASTLHLLGGGFVNAMWHENAMIVEAMRAAAEVSGARLLATGQGIMPPGPETFQGFDHVSVRDRPSADHLGRELGYDDAFLVPETPAVPDEPRATEAMVCLQGDLLNPGDLDRFVEFTTAQLRAWDIPPERVTYVEALPGEDYPGHVKLRDSFGEHRFVPFSAMWRDGIEWGPHQVWITTRFHHHLVASLHGARGIALPGKAGYYDIKHSSLAALGTGWFVSAGDPSDVRPLDALGVPHGLEKPVEAKNAEADALYRDYM
ncbi:polysaccharide pyruvyl transferase family protein [uncultured Kocuria sp.]|uniref:polysaccharide pyruvyl transferase family protein n=1 Tax=uncultured Kocuria sp. TaxID=259305 RepID=UPI0025978028|nr:polysaccharide pyruvyl transferase family protein [uncultured Kocuria sp.]MCT1367139.1 polysaccharide pyruvyl transferase family protein [Rothia sp. p3-SID1597]